MKVRCDLEKFWHATLRHPSSEKLKVRSPSPAGEGRAIARVRVNGADRRACKLFELSRAFQT
jgi:hypothetical protein